MVRRRLPLTVFRNIAVEPSGPRRGRVDVKAAGMLHLVGAARVVALEQGIAATGTIDRFQAAAAAGLYGEAEAREIIDAYQHLLRLRLVHQLEQAARGEPVDNHVDPARLSRADALLFRDALRTVARVQAGLAERFATDLVGRAGWPPSSAGESCASPGPPPGSPRASSRSTSRRRGSTRGRT